MAAIPRSILEPTKANGATPPDYLLTIVDDEFHNPIIRTEPELIEKVLED